jgi:hypothetical protein
MWRDKRQAEAAYLIAVIVASIVALVYLYLLSQITF